jgi:hypothetical protein
MLDAGARGVVPRCGWTDGAGRVRKFLDSN